MSLQKNRRRSNCWSSRLSKGTNNHEREMYGRCYHSFFLVLFLEGENANRKRKKMNKITRGVKIKDIAVIQGR